MSEHWCMLLVWHVECQHHITTHILVVGETLAGWCVTARKSHTSIRAPITCSRFSMPWESWKALIPWYTALRALFPHTPSSPVPLTTLRALFPSHSLESPVLLTLPWEPCSPHPTLRAMFSLPRALFPSHCLESPVLTASRNLFPTYCIESPVPLTHCLESPVPLVLPWEPCLPHCLKSLVLTASRTLFPTYYLESTVLHILPWEPCSPYTALSLSHVPLTLPWEPCSPHCFESPIPPPTLPQEPCPPSPHTHTLTVVDMIVLSVCAKW